MAETPTPTPTSEPAPAAGTDLGAKLYPDSAPPAEAAPAEAAPVAEAPAAGDPATPAEPAPAGEAKPEGEAPAEAPAALTVESYKDLTFPEGFTPDAEAIGKVNTIFAEAGVPVDKAQALMDIYSANLQAAVDAGANAAKQHFVDLNNKWIGELDAMPEFQGEARKQTSTILGTALDEYGSDAAREAFNVTGAGNNPAIVRFILNLANAIVEGAPTPGGGVPPNSGKSGQRKSLGQSLYGGQES